MKVLLLSAVLLAAGCASKPVDPNAACAALAQPIPAAAIGLPTSGASIESATLVAPSPLSVRPKVPFAPPPPEIAVAPALPEYCQVNGAIAPVDPKAPPIRFQVNLPTQWNGNSLQYGGGGFNGTLISGLALTPSARPDRAAPLALGYVTYGTDSGHQNAANVPLQAFALNDEALVNFAHASYKKVRDVAVELMKRRYGAAPKQLYFFGSSEGGREGITMAQRYPADFDGIFSRVPVVNWVALQAAGTRAGVAQFGDGWLSPAATRLVGEAVIVACDARDGLADGIVSDYEDCLRTFDAAKLRCTAGQTTGCLSEAQLKSVMAIQTPLRLDFALANGLRGYPSWGRGGESAAGTGPVGGWPSWQSGDAPHTLPPGPMSSRAWLYGSGAIQYFIARDPNFDPRRFNPDDYAGRMREVSALMDSTNPDLTVFMARGGKLVISVHMADYAQSPYAGIEYYKSVVARMGQPAADSFLRLYVTPGADHMGMGAPSSVDMVEVLSEWVERGKAPGDLVQAAYDLKPPFTVAATRPMCRYPAFPRYRGGDTGKAESFECAQR
ncbi:MAG TPA: tannase/feruloyl esterase family alpha/beta hydrolase [Burkholderiales bacterium]|nr:tannase/feruloyl esterase family alpha/beta hydrolase [Burkholderiales bacterium]